MKKSKFSGVLATRPLIAHLKNFDSEINVRSDPIGMLKSSVRRPGGEDKLRQHVIVSITLSIIMSLFPFFLSDIGTRDKDLEETRPNTQ